MSSLQSRKILSVATNECLAVFDRASFEINTMGEGELQREVVGLFRTQIAQTEDKIAAVANERDWKFLTHTLRGAAAAVGAFEIHAMASDWEKSAAPASSAEQQKACADLRAAGHRYFAAVNALLS